MEADGIKIIVSLEGGPWLTVERMEWKVSQGDETITMEMTPELTKCSQTKGDKIVDSFEEATGDAFGQEDRNEF